MSIKEYLDSLKGKSLYEANRLTKGICGIKDFFDSTDFSIDLGEAQVNKSEYGDWQTNFELAARICLHVKEYYPNPIIAIEPTCGTGSFILASAIVFGDSLKKIIGIEIYKPYINQLKHRLLEYSLHNPGVIKCEIELIHKSIFDISFENIVPNKNKNILIIGNPPWVTNSKLSEINSQNLPQKSNFKKVKGVEAITGKANFDITEYIVYKLLDAFHQHNACLALLMKSSVAKNIVFEQKNGRYNIDYMFQYTIDAKKEFDVSVSACMFTARLGIGNAKQCAIQDLYQPKEKLYYGWYGQNFVANVDDYINNGYIEGKCQINWWSGIKHDCSKVMELEKCSNGYKNNLHETVTIEDDLVFPILKSSDLKGETISECRKYVIVTQKNPSENTTSIIKKAPLTYNYLEAHSKYFDKRGSIIYKKRPKFCIFGVGDYSFKPYKIAIAGLYKKTTFSLVLPQDGKPTMLDDTCYLMGFNSLETAKCYQKILNSPLVQKFLNSIVFMDAKRSINKDILMRIDLVKAIDSLHSTKYISDEEYKIAMRQISNNLTGTIKYFV